MLPLAFPIIVGRKPWHEWLGWGLLATGALLLVAALVPALRPFVAVLAGAMVAGFLVYVLAPAAARFRAEGWLKPTPEGVWLNERFIASQELSQVQLAFAGYQGQRLGGRVPPHDGAGNHLTLALKSGEQLPAVEFLALAGFQRQQLAAVLQAWRQAGSKLVVDGLNLI